MITIKPPNDKNKLPIHTNIRETSEELPPEIVIDWVETDATADQGHLISSRETTTRAVNPADH